MPIRNLYLAGILLFSCPSALTAQTVATDSAKLESVEKLFEVLDLARTHDEAIESSMRDQIQANPLIAKHAQIVRNMSVKYHGFAALKADLSALYRQVYSEAEIQELIAFYQTSFGKRMTARSATVARLNTKLVLERSRKQITEMTAALLEAERGLPSAP